MVLHPEEGWKIPTNCPCSSAPKHGYSQRFWCAPHPGVLCREPGQPRSYTGLDLFIAFDHQSLAVQSWDLTTFQMPLGLLRLTTLPIGAMNTVQILQGDISFIIQE